MSENNMRTEVSYFNKRSREYKAEYDNETGEGYSFRVRRKKVLAMIPDRTNVLDIASGPGVMIPGLLLKACKITCVDAAPEMIERIKDEFGETPFLTVVVADAYRLPFEDESFEVTLAMGLIEYLENESVFLREVARVLKNGGTFIITFPNYYAPWRAFNRIGLFVRSLFKNVSKDQSVTHREYTLARARSLLARHGFATEEARFYNFKLIPYPLDRKLPRLTIWQSKLLESLDHTPFHFLGTAFILKAKKISPEAL
ncbi:MAG: Methyltransferase [Parcubacteria group bacterium GW2011_GWA2_51_10]|nr:MAG: Methyltransferase [Parcubacteria group bacterium GW2011_GWA2_51_10]